MKKFIYRILLVMLCTSYANSAKAFIPPFDFTPLIPFAPQICAMCTPSAIAEVTSTIDQVNDMRLKFKEYTNISKIKQALVSYAVGVGMTTFNNMRQKLTGMKKVTSYSITLDEKMKVDLDDEGAVKTVVTERFLQYPSKKSNIKNLYRRQSDQLKIDTTVEVYITVRQMEKDLREKMAELDKIEKCIVGGEDCSETGMEEYNCQKDGQEDEMCLWRNSLTVAQIYDMIMRYNEYIGILEAQYNTVLSIGNRPEILEYIEEDSKKSKKKSALEFLPEQDFAHSEISWNMSFAAQDTKATQNTKSDWYDGSEEKETVVTEDGFEVMDGVGGYEGALSGKKEIFESLPVLEEALGIAEKAKRAHNMKQNLRSSKKVMDSYEDMLKYHAKIVEHLEQSEICIQNYMREYYQNPLKSWTGNNCGYYDQNIYCHYSPEKKASSKSASQGIYDIACPGMEQYKCYVVDMTDTRNRSGLSGYTLALYLEAKKQEALSDEDAYLVGDDVEAQDDGKYIAPLDRNSSKDVLDEDEMEAAAKADEDGYDAEKGSKSLRKPSMEEDMIAENRKNGLIHWAIGDIVAKAMVDDLNGGANHFGNAVRSFPIWTDQKEFYDQYIDGKYENISDYIENEPFVDVLLDAAEQVYNTMTYENDDPLVDAKAKDRKDLDEAAEEIRDFPCDIEELDNVIAEEKTALANVTAKFKSDMNSLRNQIKGSYAQLDADSESLNTAQTTYNKENSRYKGADETDKPHSEDGKAIGAEMYADREDKEVEKDPEKEAKWAKVRGSLGYAEDRGDDSPIDAQFEKNVEDAEETKLDSTQKRSAQAANITTLKQRIDAGQQTIKELKAKMEDRRRTYVKEYSDTHSEWKQKIDKVLAENKTSGLGASVKGVVGNSIALSVANQAMQCVRNYALDKVKKAKEQLDGMKGGPLYVATNTDTIQGIHNKMIEQISDIDVEEVLTSEECGMDQELLQEIMTPEFIEIIAKMFNGLCEGDYCTTPEENDTYFVGAYAKKRDFRTPTGPVDFASAPLREIFHFDTSDFDDVDKYYPDGDIDWTDNRLITITGESFLNLGGDLPEVKDPDNIARNETAMPKIWHYILKPFAYEEKELDLAKLLSRGSPEDSYMRSGTFPCHINGKYVTATQNFKLAFTSKDDSVTQQNCQGIFLKDNKYPCSKETEKCEVEGPMNVAVERPSELGQILAFIPEPEFEFLARVFNPFTHEWMAQRDPFPRMKLTFNPALQKAMKIVDDYQDEDGETTEYVIARNSLLDRNQFGDYLDNIEAEAKATEIMANLSKKILAITDNLEEIFNDFGYTLKRAEDTTDENGEKMQEVKTNDDFSLLNRDDYEMAMKKLDEFKANYMRSAEAALKKVNTNISAKHIVEDVERVNNILNVLKRDAEEDVVVTGQEVVPTEIDEKIKENKANSGIGDKYEEQRKKDLDEKIKRLQAPYCAVFAK